MGADHNQKFLFFFMEIEVFFTMATTAAAMFFCILVFITGYKRHVLLLLLLLLSSSHDNNSSSLIWFSFRFFSLSFVLSIQIVYLFYMSHFTIVKNIVSISIFLFKKTSLYNSISVYFHSCSFNILCKALVLIMQALVQNIFNVSLTLLFEHAGVPRSSLF